MHKNKPGQRVLARQNVLRSGDTVFVLTQNDCADPCDLVEAQRACLAEGQFPFLTCCKSRDSHKRDTVFNVCLSVGDVTEVLDTISKYDCDEQTESVILEATEIQGNTYLNFVRSTSKFLSNIITIRYSQVLTMYLSSS